jgi:hypothetical protein
VGELTESEPRVSVKRNMFASCDIGNTKVFLDRNKEIHQVISFLFSSHKRVFHLNCNFSSSDLTHIAYKACWLASFRDENGLFKDGIVYIDLLATKTIAKLQH